MDSSGAHRRDTQSTCFRMHRIAQSVDSPLVNPRKRGRRIFMKQNKKKGRHEPVLDHRNGDTRLRGINRASLLSDWRVRREKITSTTYLLPLHPFPRAKLSKLSSFPRAGSRCQSVRPPQGST
jgi:hypothetical protein